MLAALCYAELASAVPTAGVVYTYAYTTIGEVFAWIIGWDLVLEFASAQPRSSRGWSGYLQSWLGLPTSLFGEKAKVNVGAILIVVVLDGDRHGGHPRVEWRHEPPGADVKVDDLRCFVIVAGLFFLKAAT